VTYNRCHKGKEGDEDIEIARHIRVQGIGRHASSSRALGESAVAMELRLIEQTLRNRGKVAAAGTLSISSRSTEPAESALNAIRT
jgi:hypothetical protein